MSSDASRPGDDHESVADQRVRELLDRYVQLSGATFVSLGPNLVQLTVPSSDRAAFARRSVIRLAFSVEALQEDARAEMAIVGSAFVSQLIEAVRLRGARQLVARLMPADYETVALPSLPIDIRDGHAKPPVDSMQRHRVGRLVARVVVRAGTGLEEHIAESDLFDLCTGVAVRQDVAAECERQSVSSTEAPASSTWESLGCAPMQSTAALVNSMLASLEQRLLPQIETAAASSSRELAHELARIDRYYTSLLDDIGGRAGEIADPEARSAYRTEHARRTAEERERHTVKAIVHPIQLVEWEVAVQRAEWAIENSAGRKGRLVAQRFLAGDRVWTLACPCCGIASPSRFAVCCRDHTGCTNCTKECSVCHESFCADHGISACHVDGAPACADDARTCRSCRRSHCVEHEGICDESGHEACSACLGPCAHCGRTICERHATVTKSDAPLGARRLCSTCKRTCEGGTGEVVGPDEVEGCSSCDRVVCRNHQARCAVDGKVHCSTHLRRTDRSRRLVCEQDRATCSLEPNAVLARDEVFACESCRAVICDTHSAICVVDGLRHCTTHLAFVGDRPGEFACASHRSTCHVDKGEFTTGGTKPCPSCGRLTCAQHVRRCESCGRRICTIDFGRESGRCATCDKLAPVTDPPDEILSAVIDLRGDSPTPKRWRMARDARHLIVEIDLGWTRRFVLSVPHGESRAELAIAHSILGSRRVRG